MAEKLNNLKVFFEAEKLEKRLEDLREQGVISNPDFVSGIKKRIEKVFEEIDKSLEDNFLGRSPEMLMDDLGATKKNLEDVAKKGGATTLKKLEDEMDGSGDVQDEDGGEEMPSEEEDLPQEEQLGTADESEDQSNGKSLRERIKEAKERRDRRKRAKEARDAKRRLNKQAKNLEKADDVGDTAKGLKKADDIGDVARGLKKVDDVGDAARDARKARGVVKTAQAAKAAKAAKTAATAVKAAKIAKSVTWLLNPYFWLVMVILVVLIVVIGFVLGIHSGAVNKVGDEAGGSVFVSMNCNSEYDNQLVDDVLYWTENPSGEGEMPRLGVSETLKEDLKWQGTECGIDMTHKLDNRVLETLRYLVNDPDSAVPGVAWPRIQVEMLTNGPHKTFRPLSKQEEVTYKSNEKIPMGANSPYRIGQAVGITAVGVTSSELTQAMGKIYPEQVGVDWQKMIEMGVLYPAYEQMQIDASDLFLALEKMVDVVERARPTLEAEGTDINEESFLEQVKGLYEEPQELMKNLIKNINRVASVDNPSMLEVTREYMGKARDNFTDALADIETAQTDSLLVAATIGTDGIDNPDADGVAIEDTKTYQSIREGIRFVFRGMQVANMDGWKGNTDNIALWKAYEARSNIRHLVLDILRMPFVLKDKGETSGYGPVVKQLIVFSPEDDLDNGLPDIEVYPAGAVAVSDGGIAFAPQNLSDVYRPVVDIWDNHFSSLQVDNGVLFKACTDFVYDLKALDEEGHLNDTATLGTFRADENMASLCEVLYGKSDYDLDETQMMGKVTYQKFVHIGF